MATSFTQRIIGAATLDVRTYEEIEHDRNATGQAAGVVAIAAVASAIGALGPAGGSPLIGGTITAFVGWAVWAGVTLAIGSWLFGGTADMGEMLRTLGFANAPGILYILGVVPFLGASLGGLIGLIVWPWMLACGVVAIRQALDFSTGKAIATALIGLLPYIAARAILSGLTFGLL